jgi:hypothetical protein
VLTSTPLATTEIFVAGIPLFRKCSRYAGEFTTMWVARRYRNISMNLANDMNSGKRRSRISIAKSG